MTLENTYFKKEYHYRTKFVNKCVAIIRFSDDEKRVKAYKNLVFRMMKDIVKKNISNCMNLLKGTYRKDKLSERDELLAVCYIIFDKCLEKYIIDENNNFYFYFNKSLSRNFFRYYQKELQRSNGVEITEELMTVNSGFHDNSQPDTMEFLFANLGLNDLEKRICRSRIIGQKTSEFLKENSDITDNQYSRSLKKIKEILIIFQQKGEL